VSAPEGGTEGRASVVVVGAGPTGVTAAILLADQGVDVLVLDRFAEVYPRPRAVALDDEIHRILGRLDVLGEFAAISRPAQGLRLVDGGDRAVLADFGRSMVGEHGYPESSLFDQPELEGVLRAALARRPTARFRGDVDVTGVVANELAGGATVELTDRTTGATETLVADYVLGCDGANSVVRAGIGARLTDLGFTQRWLVADLATTADLDQWEGIHQVCSAERGATYMRIGEDRYRWEFQLHDGESAADYPTVDALRPLLRPWLRGTPSDELTLLRITDYTFHARVADRWRSGPVFILGDAAHLTPPFIGQGMGAGLRDAMNLGWKVAAVLGGRLPAAVLDSYEAERKPHATAMIRKAVRVGQVMTGGGRVGTALRRAVAPRMSAERFGDPATPALRRSSLVRRGRLAGTLCPNALLGAVRLDELARGRFALVTDLPVHTGVRHAAEHQGVAVLATGPDEPLGRWLAGGRARAALVRPDGTVLTAGPTIAGALEPLAAS
jgi:3-(3-hydroxy-phenyl)propionate hydroxylase